MIDGNQSDMFLLMMTTCPSGTGAGQTMVEETRISDHISDDIGEEIALLFQATWELAVIGYQEEAKTKCRDDET